MVKKTKWKTTYSNYSGCNKKRTTLVEIAETDDGRKVEVYSTPHGAMFRYYSLETGELINVKSWGGSKEATAFSIRPNSPTLHGHSKSRRSRMYNNGLLLRLLVHEGWIYSNSLEHLRCLKSSRYNVSQRLRALSSWGLVRKDGDKWYPTELAMSIIEEAGKRPLYLDKGVYYIVHRDRTEELSYEV